MGMAQPSFSLLRYTTLALNGPEVMSTRTELFIWGSHKFPRSASLLVPIKDIDEDCGTPKGTEGRGGGGGGQYFAFFSNGSFMGGAVYFIFPRPDHSESWRMDRWQRGPCAMTKGQIFYRPARPNSVNISILSYDHRAYRPFFFRVTKFGILTDVAHFDQKVGIYIAIATKLF